MATESNDVNCNDSSIKQKEEESDEEIGTNKCYDSEQVKLLMLNNNNIVDDHDNHHHHQEEDDWTDFIKNKNNHDKVNFIKSSNICQENTNDDVDDNNGDDYDEKDNSKTKSSSSLSLLNDENDYKHAKNNNYNGGGVFCVSMPSLLLFAPNTFTTTTSNVNLHYKDDNNQCNNHFPNDNIIHNRNCDSPLIINNKSNHIICDTIPSAALPSTNNNHHKNPVALHQSINHLDDNQGPFNGQPSQPSKISTQPPPTKKQPSSILKTSSSSKSMYCYGGHRKNCPKGLQQLRRQQHNNFSEKEYEDDDNGTVLKDVSNVSTNNAYIKNQIDLFSSFNNNKKRKNNSKRKMDKIISFGETATNDNNNLNIDIIHQWWESTSSLDEYSSDSNANTLKNGKKKKNNVKCTCYDQPESTTKSVQILTPDKSEQILFDPKLSVADSIIHKPHLSSTTTNNNNNTNNLIKHQPQPQSPKQITSSSSSPSISLQSNCKPSPFVLSSHCHIDNENNNNQKIVFNKMTATSNTTTKSLMEQQQSHYCNCSPEQINLITYQICLNCQRPVLASSTNSTLSNTNAIFRNIDNDNNKPHLIEDDNVQRNPSDTNASSIPNTPLIDNNPSIIYAPLASIASGPGVCVNDNNHDNHEQDFFLSNQDIEYDSTTYMMVDQDYDDDDRPRFCHKCNIWFDSFDASYPITCKCNQPTSNNNFDGGNFKSNTLNTNDSGSIYSVHMQKDFRYYFQHPYLRLFVAYFVIFCNFLMFAEDPLSHSLIECSIPVLGNVISLIFTKYPPEFEWQFVKASISLSAIIIGSLFGKFILHHIILQRIFRLKMFREESGTWMIMLISTFMSCYLFSQFYNTLLFLFHPNYGPLLITSKMGLTYASFMKLAACGTWCGDFFTAWMITDMMLQDNLYPHWAIRVRAFWHEHANIRIVVFWTGALVIAAAVISIILTDAICWDCLTHGLISTTEFHRAFLASLILVMDLLIVMQDWDFPHFVCDLNIKLPGLLQPSYTFNFFDTSVKFPPIEIKITGKWFNYGIIVFVMMLDLNMWKNQVIYYPEDYGQYIDPENNRVCSITDTQSIVEEIKWTFRNRSTELNPSTNRKYIEDDLMIYSRYMGYAWIFKTLSIIPIFGGFLIFFVLVYVYGRFPPKTDASLGGRLPKRCKSLHHQSRSSWRRERRDDSRRNTNKQIISWPKKKQIEKFIKINGRKVSFIDRSENHVIQAQRNNNPTIPTANIFITDPHLSTLETPSKPSTATSGSSSYLINIFTPFSSRIWNSPQHLIYTYLLPIYRNEDATTSQPPSQTDGTSPPILHAFPLTATSDTPLPTTVVAV